jgi:ubiquinone/menaquinone biosynthesis C-methylase UbiE
MYKTYAVCYDQFYRMKEYAKESEFLNRLLSKYQVNKVLDVGCGTGTHLSHLARYGYKCEGLDLNEDMLAVAKKKHKGTFHLADMRNFNLKRKYDAIVAMFGVFNHNLDIDDGLKTLVQLKNHLQPNGILALDLYQPQQKSGEKLDSSDEVQRHIRWKVNKKTQIVESAVRFFERTKIAEEKFLLKIYPIPLVKQFLQEAGFKDVQLYDNYTFDPGTSKSKNLIVVAR